MDTSIKDIPPPAKIYRFRQIISRTNEPGTCLWCGRKLHKHFSRDWPINQLHPSESKTLDGYGDYADNAFCGLHCGYEFGISMAAGGKRLGPYEGKP